MVFHRMPHRRGRVAAGLAGLILSGWFGAWPAAADEGMWLFNEVPGERLERNHGFTPPAGWLERLQRAAVRFNSGGSGAFVSADGLVLTNHHVAASSLQKLSTADRNLAQDGYLARTQAEEMPCLDLELNVLVSMEDVTDRVAAAVADTADPAAAALARREVLASIENQSLETTGLRSDVITLFGGGRYQLYRFRRYTDIRLVFAPEREIAFFGGDADNFEYPRHCLDICFFRAYEDGQPVEVEDFLSWADRDVAAGDLIFVAGHPGHTDRAKTLVEVTAMRDRQLPFSLEWLNRREVLLQSYAEEGRVEAQQAMHDLFGVQNSRKARSGLLAALLRPEVISQRAAAEAGLQAAWRGDQADSPWVRIAAAQQAVDTIALRYNLLEGAMAFRSRFFAHARTLLRAAAEAAKPDGQRLREYRDAARASLELQLFSEEPLDDAYEVATLTDSLTFMATKLGIADPLVQQVLAGKSPAERAAVVIAGTRLGSRRGAANGQPVDRRRKLYEGGPAAIAASDDAMLALARLVDAESRRLRLIVEEAGETKQQAHAELLRLRLQAASGPIYPDATFTLRLAYGTVQGVGGDAEAATPRPWTTLADLYAKVDREHGRPPFAVPDSWQAARERLGSSDALATTPLNFLSTADIIGGNSGSPVVDRQGRLVGVIFDGNEDSLVLNIAYDADRARAIAVSAGGIVAALKEVYRADRLLEELGLSPRGWTSLFDGKKLGGWQSSGFGTDGPIAVDAGAITIGMGDPLSGITWQREFPTDRYEIALEAQRTDGFDFFCGLTFPVGDDSCSLILGGWGGGLIGLSSIDGADASENDTTQYQEFETGRWYDVRVRVEPEAITCLLDGKEIVSQPRAGHEISIRAEMFLCKPLGVATYATASRLRNLRYRRLDGPVDDQAGDEQP